MSGCLLLTKMGLGTLLETTLVRDFSPSKEEEEEEEGGQHGDRTTDFCFLRRSKLNSFMASWMDESALPRLCREFSAAGRQYYWH